MPDRYGFDHLGSDVRCIETGCGDGGRAGAWPEKRRASHARSHSRAAETTAKRERARREKEAIELRRAQARENALAYGVESRVVYSRRSRTTETLVEIVDDRAGEASRSWLLRCVDHDQALRFDTRRSAKLAAAHPERWCPTCQEEEG